MRSDLTKHDYLILAIRRKAALQNVAKILGKDHALTKLMGELAWGRSEAEQIGSGATLRTAIAEWAFLGGCYDILNKWAHTNSHKAQSVLINCWRESRGDSVCTEAPK